MSAKKPRGRPRKRTEEIRLRVTPEEKLAIKKLAKLARMSVTKLITLSVIEGRGTHIQQADPQLLDHLLRIGVNLNQIARSCNACSRSGQTIDLLQVQLQLREIKRSLSAYAAPA